MFVGESLFKGKNANSFYRPASAISGYESLLLNILSKCQGQ